MKSTCMLDPEPRAAFWTADYLLHHCEGFLVDTDKGHLGYVADVEEIDDATVELIVAGPDGTYRVSSRTIQQFDPEAERIAIAGEPGWAARRRWSADSSPAGSSPHHRSASLPIPAPQAGAMTPVDEARARSAHVV